ncbi:sensor histidine kinase [Hydrogenimonas sp.]
MQRESIKTFFQGKDHKKIMLGGLYFSSVIMLIGLSLFALYMGHQTVFYAKFALAVVLSVLLVAFLITKKTPLFALLFLLVIEVESSTAMLSKHFYDFVTVYPFFPIFGFFFFFRLATAVWMTVVHFIFWVGVSIYGYDAFSSHPLFHMVPLINMIASTIVVILVALFYHISTEKTYEKLEHANRQKEILIKEIHHRFKNNLNKIASLLGLQIMKLEAGSKESPIEVLKKNKLRVEMMAMVHDSLYKADDLDNVDAATYIENLTDLVGNAYGRSVPVTVESDGIVLPLEKMLKVGLIINELYTNTLKHAKEAEGDRLRVEIFFFGSDGTARMLYRQRGHVPIGMDSLEKSDGLGMTLVHLSVEEMDGTFEVSNDENSLEFKILFPCEKAK